MYYYGPLRMAEQSQDDQLEHTYSSYVRIRDVALKTCQRWWTIGRRGERGSGISVLAVWHDDDDDDDDEFDGLGLFNRFEIRNFEFRLVKLSLCHTLLKNRGWLDTYLEQWYSIRWYAHRCWYASHRRSVLEEFPVSHFRMYITQCKKVPKIFLNFKI